MDRALDLGEAADGEDLRRTFPPPASMRVISAAASEGAPAQLIQSGAQREGTDQPPKPKSTSNPPAMTGGQRQQRTQASNQNLTRTPLPPGAARIRGTADGAGCVKISRQDALRIGSIVPANTAIKSWPDRCAVAGTESSPWSCFEEARHQRR